MPNHSFLKIFRSIFMSFPVSEKLFLLFMDKGIAAKILFRFKGEPEAVKSENL
jgi:hypothetical protein